jgi:hypothetical protein
MRKGLSVASADRVACEVGVSPDAALKLPSLVVLTTEVEAVQTALAAFADSDLGRRYPAAVAT